MKKVGITIGLPRALLYYRYRVFWETFFQELGFEIVVSEPTNREILEQGAALAIDEACLSLKVYLGHVAALVGKCDFILIPRISNFGRHRNMCTRFEALPDLTRHVFRDRRLQILSYELDVLEKRTRRTR